MGRFVIPKTVLPRAQSKQIGGVVKYLCENKVLATPLENNDQSAFIARPNISSECVCGGGGMAEHNSDRTEHRDEVGKKASWENCNFGKVQFWKRLLL